MGELFHGWRRKLGVVTLVMACVLMAGWIRSETIGDDITFRLGKCGHEIRSERSRITSISTWVRDSRWLPENEWTTGFSPEVDSGSIWDRIGFLYNVCENNDADSNLSFQRLLMVPYWSIVIPLTLLSAYLLLGKPRIAKPEIVSENPNPEQTQTGKARIFGEVP